MSEPSADTLNPTRDDFAALLNENMSEDALKEGSVVKGTVVSIEKDLPPKEDKEKKPEAKAVINQSAKNEQKPKDSPED